MRRNPIPHQPVLLLAIVAIAAIGATATRASQKKLTVPQMKERRASVRQQIDSLVENRSCQADVDCASVALGRKPCGGPWEYLVYSKANVPAKPLEHKIQEYDALDQSLNEAEQLVSTCDELPAPQPKCLSQTCVDASRTDTNSLPQ